MRSRQGIRRQGWRRDELHVQSERYQITCTPQQLRAACCGAEESGDVRNRSLPARSADDAGAARGRACIAGKSPVVTVEGHAAESGAILETRRPLRQRPVAPARHARQLPPLLAALREVRRCRAAAQVVVDKTKRRCRSCQAIAKAGRQAKRLPPTAEAPTQGAELGRGSGLPAAISARPNPEELSGRSPRPAADSMRRGQADVYSGDPCEADFARARERGGPTIC